ncbi:5'-3' exonuclease H3TH domain-containing protein [Amycolatopsis sp. NPDC059019]|uniref:5'-3' exonuclease n=1 Tax=Amycolatopsis sp. NPDC059019 TaxID=3346702 RepID=UPI00366CE532
MAPRAPGRSQRQGSDGEYKANRVVDEAALKPLRAIPHVQQALTGYGIGWIEIDTAEADDVIATLVAATRDRLPERRVWIMSGDRDFYQLLDEQVRALNTVMKRGRRHIGPAEVVDRYGVTPDQWPDFCALKGDSADNIPGVRGIGPSTAAKLLSGGLHLEQLPTSARLTGAKKAAVTGSWQQVLAWRDLIRMRTNLDLPLYPAGGATRELPKPADVIEKLGLW